MLSAAIQAARYGGDLELFGAIQADRALKQQLERTEVLRRRSLARMRLLSNAVPVSRRLTPGLADSVDRLSAHLRADKPLEVYVFADHDINAFVAEGSRRLLVAVSSGAVSTLAGPELEFVIGHEFGHVMFGHVDIPAEAVLEIGELTPSQARLLRSWQRATEISADRAGFLCSGSLEVAANALFKTLSGLALEGVQVDPEEMAQQWSRLAEEILDYGGREHWQLAHPFPPLRMRALQLYRLRGSAADGEIQHLLGLMEDTVVGAPRVAADPMLARFHFWGGLYVALADGPANPPERELLEGLAPPGLGLERALAETEGRMQACLERFSEARSGRQTKLSSAELHRIVQGLVAAAVVDGPLNDPERTHLHRLGEVLGLRPEAVDLMSERQSKGNP